MTVLRMIGNTLFERTNCGCFVERRNSQSKSCRGNGVLLVQHSRPRWQVLKTGSGLLGKGIVSPVDRPSATRYSAHLGYSAKVEYRHSPALSGRWLEEEFGNSQLERRSRGPLPLFTPFQGVNGKYRACCSATGSWREMGAFRIPTSEVVYMVQVAV